MALEIAGFVRPYRKENLEQSMYHMDVDADIRMLGGSSIGDKIRTRDKSVLTLSSLFLLAPSAC